VGLRHQVPVIEVLEITAIGAFGSLRHLVSVAADGEAPEPSKPQQKFILIKN